MLRSKALKIKADSLESFNRLLNDMHLTEGVTASEISRLLDSLML